MTYIKYNNESTENEDGSVYEPLKGFDGKDYTVATDKNGYEGLYEFGNPEPIFETDNSTKDEEDWETDNYIIITGIGDTFNWVKDTYPIKLTKMEILLVIHNLRELYKVTRDHRYDLLKAIINDEELTNKEYKPLIK